MPLLAATTFLSAYLLFQVQPLVGRIVLPWFGGTPAVWTTCMLFFQVVLLAGYGYSHYLATRLSHRGQTWLHLTLLAVALAALAGGAAWWGTPLLPGESLRPPDASAPVARILLILAVGAGVPYFVLSTTGPLLQAWTARLHPGGTPWRLYAVSNAGSILGLVAYPVMMEPLFAVRAQAWSWTSLFGAFTALCALLAVKAGRASGTAAPGVPAEVAPAAAGEAPSKARMAAWVTLPAIASVLLLAVTNQLTQEVAPVPFLWVLPLVLYLFSFILTFESDRWYRRGRFLPFFALLSLGVGTLLMKITEPQIWVQVTVYGGLLFAGCMMMHGELARLRPAPRHLTGFYLAVSVGGAAGGLFVALLAPALFRGYWELHAGVAAAWVAVIWAMAADRRSALFGRFSVLARTALALGFLGTLLLLWLQVLERAREADYTERDFYGVLRVAVVDSSDPAMTTAVLLHGRIIHGFQHASAERRHQPTAYFTETSGVGTTFAALGRLHHAQGLKVGIIGLGVGTLAAYGRPGDEIRFYEINPLVARLAEGEGGWFSYLPESKAKVDVVLGDARLSLERELKTGSRRYDLFVVDAFSSDSIPFHLLTRQSVALYLEHLAAGGVLALHVTNLYLDLEPVVLRIARELSLHAAIVRSPGRSPTPALAEAKAATWILLSRTREVLDSPEVKAVDEDQLPPPAARLWTDDYVSPLEIIRR